MEDDLSMVVATVGDVVWATDDGLVATVDLGSVAGAATAAGAVVVDAGCSVASRPESMVVVTAG